MNNPLPNLVNSNDFQRLTEYLELILDDFQQINDGKTILNVLDYHVIHSLGMEDSADFYSETLRYAISISKVKYNQWFVLPVSYYEMENNINFIYHQIQAITRKDLDLLKKDPKVQKFKLAMEDYIISKDSIELYHEVRHTFRDAFLENKRKNIKKSFFKVLRFFYYDNLFIKPFTSMIILLDNGLITSFQEIQKMAKTEKFEYSQELYKKAFSALSPVRIKWHSDIIDSLCYAMCIALIPKIQDMKIRFITSPAPFESFYHLQFENQPKLPIIRNVTIMALEKYILDINEKSLNKSIKYVEEKINYLKKASEETNYHTPNKREMRSKIRVDFRENVRKAILDNNVDMENDAFLSFLRSNDLTSILHKDDAFPLAIREFKILFSKLDSLRQRAQFEKEKIRAKEIFDTILQMLHEYIFVDYQLESEIQRISNIVKNLRQNMENNIEDMMPGLEARLEYMLKTDANEWDPILAQNLKIHLLNTRHRTIILPIVCKYYQISKDEDKLDFSRKIRNILRDMDLNCNPKAGDKYDKSC